MLFYLTNFAQKELAKIRRGDKKAGSRIDAFFQELAAIDDFRNLSNVKKLAGSKNEWRSRVGEHRLEFRVLKLESGFAVLEFLGFESAAESGEILEFHKIGPRQNAYKK